MKTNGIGTSRRSLRRAGALAVGLVLAACSGSHDDQRGEPSQASPTLGASSTSSAKDPRLEAWNKVMLDAKPPRDGCFRSSYPSTTWTEVPCGPAPTGAVASHGPPPSSLTPLPKRVEERSAGGFVPVGNGNDWFAQFPGPITDATGSFPSASGDTATPAYSVQLNSNGFGTTNAFCNAATNPRSCFGWQQAVYGISGPNQTGLFFEYWLENYGNNNNCPSQWQTDGKGNCFHNSSSVANVPLVPLTELSGMKMRVQAGSSDVLTMTIEGTAYSGSFGSILGLNDGNWNLAEFGVFGDGNLSNVQFSANSTVVGEITSSSAGSPTCATKANISTGETSNLTFEPNCCWAYGNGIEFEESNTTPPSCSVCGNEGQACCSTSTACASPSDVCYSQTCMHCGGNGEPCCAGNTCTASGVVCQQGACGLPNTLVASPSSLSVEAGDGTTGANSASTDFEASGYWANDPYESPSLAISAIGVPPGVPMPAAGVMPLGLSWAITNDINPPTVRFTAATDTVAGTYTFLVTGTIGNFTASTTLPLTVGACQPITCAAAGWTCGSFDNECGQTVTCGTCPSGDSCVGGTCTPTCNKYCPPPEFLNPYSCTCESCQCGTIIVGGHRICAVCKP